VLPSYPPWPLVTDELVFVQPPDPEPVSKLFEYFMRFSLPFSINPVGPTRVASRLASLLMSKSAFLVVNSFRDTLSIEIEELSVLLKKRKI
jgi:hypothetical protein